MTALSANDTPDTPDSPAAPDAPDTRVPRSIGRLLDLLELVIHRRSSTLTAAADETGLTPTTARRYLQALAARGYVERTGGEYTPGPAIRDIAETLRTADEVQYLAARAQPHLERLAADTGETTYLAVADGDTAAYIATAESSRAIRHVGGVGQRVPLAGTAVGAALAAPGRPVTRSGTVEPDIAAVSLGLGGDWHGRAAISVVGPAHRFTREIAAGHEAALRDTVDALDHRLQPVNRLDPDREERR